MIKAETEIWILVLTFLTLIAPFIKRAKKQSEKSQKQNTSRSKADNPVSKGLAEFMEILEQEQYKTQDETPLATPSSKESPDSAVSSRLQEVEPIMPATQTHIDEKEELDLEKLIVYSEIMKPKYKVY